MTGAIARVARLEQFWPGGYDSVAANLRSATTAPWVVLGVAPGASMWAESCTLMTAALTGLPGHRAMLEFATSIDAPLPERAREISAGHA